MLLCQCCCCEARASNGIREVYLLKAIWSGNIMNGRLGLGGLRKATSRDMSSVSRLL